MSREVLSICGNVIIEVTNNSNSIKLNRKTTQMMKMIKLMTTATKNKKNIKMIKTCLPSNNHEFKKLVMEV
jgi:hypothetical protein